MNLAFDHPELLALLLLAVPMVWLGVRHLKVLDKPRRVTALLLRGGVLIMLVLILAGLRTEQTHTDLTVVAVADRSQSVKVFGAVPVDPAGRPVAPDMDSYVLDYLEQAARDRRPEDRLGLVTYDARPSIRVRPDLRSDLTVGTLDNPREGTDTARAIEYALAAKQDADTALRLVLATDGNDTSGNLLAAARSAAAAGVAIDVLSLPYRVGDEVMVEGVYAPAEAREGQTVSVRVVLNATRPADGTLQLLHDTQPVDLNGAEPGTGVPVRRGQWVSRSIDPDEPGTGHVMAITLDIPLGYTGPNSFTAVFEPTDVLGQTKRVVADRVINNQAQTFTQVAGKGRLLLVNHVEGQPGRILPEALRSRGLELDTVQPAGFPVSLSELQRYDAVVFQNVPADDISPAQQTLLVKYVHDLGGGFVMIGGPDSFGAGGWTNSDVDRKLLPVTCEIPSQTILPSGALVIVIDRSGSMGSPVTGAGATQLELAAEAAVLALKTLYPQDMIGVVSFDSSAKWISPLQENRDPAGVASDLRSMQPGGGTDIYSGLAAAYNALADPKASVRDNAVRHMILLSDGESPGQFDALINRMRRDGITLSTVGVGDGHQSQLLQQLAHLGGGSYHPIADPNNLPQVFIKEARQIRKNLIKEEAFTPKQVNTGSPITAGISFTRQLSGLVLTGPRRDRRVDMPLLGPEGEPLFAHWQVGLGRAAAFTSDATNRWATPWLGWAGYADFWARTMRTIARPTASRDADLLATLENSQLKLRLDTGYADAEDQSDNPAGAVPSVRGGVLDPQGNIVPVTLSQTGPGVFEASVPAGQTGNYIASLYLMSPDGQRKAVFGGATRPPGEELRNFAPNHALLRQIAEETGGRVLDPRNADANPLFARTEEFVSVSTRPLRWALLPWLVALLMLDIANRRIAWDAAAMAGWVKDRVRPSRVSEESKQTLSALKKRKAGVQQQHGEAEPGGDAPAVPAAVPDTTRKFEAQPGAVASNDFAGAVGAASNTVPRSRAAPRDTADEDDTSTTSRLLAAKRRAQEEE